MATKNGRTEESAAGGFIECTRCALQQSPPEDERCRRCGAPLAGGSINLLPTATFFPEEPRKRTSVDGAVESEDTDPQASGFFGDPEAAELDPFDGPSPFGGAHDHLIMPRGPGGASHDAWADGKQPPVSLFGDGHHTTSPPASRKPNPAPAEHAVRRSASNDSPRRPAPKAGHDEPRASFMVAAKDILTDGIERSREALDALPRPGSMPRWLRWALAVFVVGLLVFLVTLMTRPDTLLPGTYESSSLGLQLEIPETGWYRQTVRSPFGPIEQLRDDRRESEASTLIIIRSVPLSPDHAYAPLVEDAGSAKRVPGAPLDADALLVDSRALLQAMLTGTSLRLVLQEDRGCQRETIGERRAARCRLLASAGNAHYELDLLAFGTNTRLVTTLLLNRTPVSVDRFHQSYAIFESITLTAPSRDAQDE